MTNDPSTLWVTGESTGALEAFLALVDEYRIGAIADMRRFPGWRRYSHFASEAMARSLPAHGIAYAWIPQPGGRSKV